MALSSNNCDDGIEMEPLTKQQTSTGAMAKQKKPATTKKLQFSTPEFSITPIPISTFSTNNRLVPSRRRYI